MRDSDPVTCLPSSRRDPAADPLGVPCHRLQSDLARYCLPATQRDDTRRLAWAASVCLLFLAVALLGLRQPVPVVRQLPPRTQPTPVALLVPPNDTEPAPPSAISSEHGAAEPDPVPEAVEKPTVVPVIVAVPEAASFPVPIDHFDAIAREPAQVPPPPAIAIRPPNPPPDPPPAPRTNYRAIRIGGKEFRKQPPPGYPEEFRRNRVGGTVEVLITLGTNGLPSAVTVGNSSGSPALDRHVCDFIRKEWKADPGAIAHYRIAITFLP